MTHSADLLVDRDDNLVLLQGICPGNRLRIVAGVFDASAALQRRRARAPAPVAHQPMPAQQSPAFTKVSQGDVLSWSFLGLLLEFKQTYTD